MAAACHLGRNGKQHLRLGLYVHSVNESALRVYAKEGFEVVAKNDDGLLYMTRRN